MTHCIFIPEDNNRLNYAALCSKLPETTSKEITLQLLRKQWHGNA